MTKDELEGQVADLEARNARLEALLNRQSVELKRVVDTLGRTRAVVKGLSALAGE